MASAAELNHIACLLGPQVVIAVACVGVMHFWKLSRQGAAVKHEAEKGKQMKGPSRSPARQSASLPGSSRQRRDDYKQLEDVIAFEEKPLDYLTDHAWKSVTEAAPEIQSVADFVTKHRARLLLYALVFNLITYAAGPTSDCKLLRLSDLPFVLWLQLPRASSHKFVTHALGRVWPVMRLVEMAYAYFHSNGYTVLGKLLIGPLAVYQWIVYDRVVTAEQSLRARKGKKLSLTECVFIYLPLAIKGSFYATRACLDISTLVVVDKRAWSWFQLLAVSLSQYIIFSLGIWSMCVHQGHVAVWFSLWALARQPRYLPIATPLLVCLLMCAYVAKTSQHFLWPRHKRSSHEKAAAVPHSSDSSLSAAATPRSTGTSRSRSFSQPPVEVNDHPTVSGLGWTIIGVLKSRIFSSLAGSGSGSVSDDVRSGVGGGAPVAAASSQ